jgi:hypothetical protein
VSADGVRPSTWFASRHGTHDRDDSPRSRLPCAWQRRYATRPRRQRVPGLTSRVYSKRSARKRLARGCTMSPRAFTRPGQAGINLV